MKSDRCRAAILVSGSGTNLQAFIDSVAAGQLELDIVAVCSNQPDAHGLRRAEQAGLATICLPHTGFAERESFDKALAAQLDVHSPELIILAGFMRILSPWFVAHYMGRILNIHPALLPAYPGLNTHQRVLDSGDEWHGSTVHFVSDELDAGPRILQGRLRVNTEESRDDLARRVQAIEHVIYPAAAAMFASGSLVFRDGAAWLDGDRLDTPVRRDF